MDLVNPINVLDEPGFFLAWPLGNFESDCIRSRTLRDSSTLFTCYPPGPCRLQIEQPGPQQFKEL